MRIIVPTARHGLSQGENGNVDRFLMPRDSFTFRGRNEEGQLSNERSICQPERSEGRQRSEVRQSFRVETKERETFSRQRKWSECTVSLPGIAPV